MTEKDRKAMEEWGVIPGAEEYRVSREGEVYSTLRGGRLLSQHCNRRGYPCVSLWLDGKYRKTPVHRLVALSYLKPVIGKEYVNHIDSDKTNNAVSNLEWVTMAENFDHSFKNGLHAHPKRPVIARNRHGAYVGCYESIREASRQLCVSATDICKCVKGKRDTAGGFVWKYKEHSDER